VIADSDGLALINPTGNPGLATGGTGDVLAGVCGSLLAQGWPAWEAALGAVWMHGAGADALVLAGAGPVGMTAGELPAAIRSVFNQLLAPGARPRS
jgi:NAD(P)H-hydrate repair Nnr-like enzyme with NAD(P)H-hydrate dehydratase domain